MTQEMNDPLDDLLNELRKENNKMFDWFWRIVWWVRQFPFRVRMRWQRMTRGYSDLEVWNLNSTISRFLEPRIRALAENVHSAPYGYPDINATRDPAEVVTDFAAWEQDLLDFADTLADYIECEDMTSSGWGELSIEEQIAHESRVSKDLSGCLHWMADWYHGLWD